MSVDNSERITPAAVLDPTVELPGGAYLDLFSDAAQTIELGGRLAEAISGAQPDVVVFSWTDSSSAVLAHVVSARLGVPAVRVVEQSGIVQLLDEIPAGARVVILVDSFPSRTSVRGIVGVTEHNAGVPVLIATVLPDDGAQTSSADSLCLAEHVRAGTGGP